MVTYLDKGFSNIGIVQSRPIILERESDWYACPNYNIKKRSNMLAELLLIANMPTTNINAKTIQDHAVYHLMNMLKYDKAKKQTWRLLYLLFIFNRKAAIEIIKFKIHQKFSCN
jgi:hypothetical protein